MEIKKTVSFSLTKETIDKIAELSFRSKLKKSAVIELLVQYSDIDTLIKLMSNSNE